MILSERYLGAMLGLAVGDALGSQCEGKSREYCMNLPTIDMVGSPRHGISPGQFTDDTSMALCLGQSLLDCGEFNPADQLEKYRQWRDNGYMGCNQKCIGIGKTTSCSIDDYFMFHHNPLGGPVFPNTAGNGSIMRLAPVPLFYYPNKAEVIHYSGISSLTTHGAYESVGASALFGFMIYNALAGLTKEEILTHPENSCYITNSALPSVEYDDTKLLSIANAEYMQKPDLDIRGTAYVIESLEAALWCFYKTDNYVDAVTLAIRLGDDTDTTAAIVGQLAGAYYGSNEIPTEWVGMLDMIDTIVRMSLQLYSNNHKIEIKG